MKLRYAITRVESISKYIVGKSEASSVRKRSDNQGTGKFYNKEDTVGLKLETSLWACVLVNIYIVNR